MAARVARASKTYPNGLRALEPISLELAEGEFVTVIGPSGCGKSTLLRMIAGLTPQSEGEITLWPDELDTSAQTDRRLAFVFQHATLMPWASVEGNVMLPLKLSAGPLAQERVDHALELVGLSEFRRAYPRELSGGMQMRVSIARALATAPRLLLMDEPFGALDEITRGKLDLKIRDLWARESLTALFVTHSLQEAVFLSTRVLVMSARPGRICGEMRIDEPHPRTDAFRLSDRFTAYCRELNDLLFSNTGFAAATA